MKQNSIDDQRNQFVCTDCFKLKKCKESFVSWAFFLVALVATISIRMVNVGFDQILGKLFWYIGIIGFFAYFIYKYQVDHTLHRELDRTKLVDKILNRQSLSAHDYDVLGAIMCRISSRKDKINYFFIFFSSGIVLLIALYVDFIRH